MDPARFVFLDETGTSTNTVRRYGRCPGGERLVDATPWGHWKITTFVAGLRANGLIAPMVLDGPMTGEVFQAYVEQVLIPELSPGDVVVLDNLAAHKVAGIREKIQAAGASLLYLPPYSPDLNPIEQMFAKARRLLAPSRHSGPPLANCSTASRRTNAGTTSATADTSSPKSNLL
jgi:transposase